MKRRLIPLLLFGTFVVWLVGSYLPQGVVPWRTIPGDGMDAVLRGVIVACALLFVLIQGVLVASVFKFPHRISRHEERSLVDDAISVGDGGEILVKRRWELLWTVTPLVASLLLFVVSYWALSG